MSHFLHLIEILPDGDTPSFMDPCVVAVFLASQTRATRRHIEALEGYTLFLLFHRVNGKEEAYSSNTNFEVYVEHRTILKSGEHLTFIGIQN